MLDMVGRIARAVDVPVSADLEAGYGDPGETIRRAIGEGIVGANLEDQLKPLDESIAAVEAAVAAAEAEGVPFVLNARTDALASWPESPPRGVDRRRRRARPRLSRCRRDLRLRAGQLRRSVVVELVAGIGDRRVSLFGAPDVPAPAAFRSSVSPASRTARCRSGWRSAPFRTSRATSSAGACRPAASAPSPDAHVRIRRTTDAPRAPPSLGWRSGGPRRHGPCGGAAPLGFGLPA